MQMHRQEADARWSLAWLFGSRFLSDADLVFVEEEANEATPPATGPPGPDGTPHPSADPHQGTGGNSSGASIPPASASCIVPCHALLLCQHSRVLQTLVELHASPTPPPSPPCSPRAAAAAAGARPSHRQQQQHESQQRGQPTRHRIVLHVGAGQLPAARLLLQSMYDPEALLRIAEQAASGLHDGPASGPAHQRPASFPSGGHAAATPGWGQEEAEEEGGGQGGAGQGMFPPLPSLAARARVTSASMLPAMTPVAAAQPLPRNRRLSEHGGPVEGWQRGGGAGEQGAAGGQSGGGGGGGGGDGGGLVAGGEEARAPRPLQLLLDVIRLADRYQADAVMQAAADALHSLRDLWSWRDICAMLDLPAAALVSSRALLPLLLAAREAVWDAFHDLEEAWRDSARRAMWLQLPLCAVEWVLRRQDLKVGSEATVFVALTHAVERGTGQHASQQQLAALAGLLQTHRLTPAFLLAVVRDRPWFRRAHSVQQQQPTSAPDVATSPATNQSTTAAAGGSASASGTGGVAPALGGSLEELLASYIMHISGLATVTRQCMPWRRGSSLGGIGSRRIGLGLAPRCASHRSALLHASVSMTLLQRALDEVASTQAEGSTTSSEGDAQVWDESLASLLRGSHSAPPAGSGAAAAGSRAWRGRVPGAGGRWPATPPGLPKLLAASEPVYSCGYYFVLEMYLAEDRDESSLVACVYSTGPAVPLLPPRGPSPAPAAAGAAQGRSVVVTAHVHLSAYDHELEEWGLLYQAALPARTGFGDTGAVRHTEFYPIWGRTTLAKLVTPSAWQRRAYAPEGKLHFRAELNSVE